MYIRVGQLAGWLAPCVLSGAGLDARCRATSWCFECFLLTSHMMLWECSLHSTHAVQSVVCRRPVGPDHTCYWVCGAEGWFTSIDGVHAIRICVNGGREGCSMVVEGFGLRHCTHCGCSASALLDMVPILERYKKHGGIVFNFGPYRGCSGYEGSWYPQMVSPLWLPNQAT